MRRLVWASALLLGCGGSSGSGGGGADMAPGMRAPSMKAPAMKPPAMKPPVMRRNSAMTPPVTKPYPDSLAPLDAAARGVLKTVTGERLKPVRPHYFSSNETRYDLWYRFIKGLGEAYLGVGPDQNYSLATVAQAKLVILMDYDQAVLDTHRLYLALTKACEQPGCVLDLLKKKNRRRVIEILKKEYPPKLAARALWVQKQGSFIHARHRMRIRKPMHAGGRFWLTDPELYRRWRKLVQTGRVWLYPGDLTKGITIGQIASALKQLKIPLRVIYFSNAEEFWAYTKGFKENVAALPFDARSMVIRSIVIGDKYKIGYKFHYTIQKAPDFVAWLKRPRWLRIHQIIRLRQEIDGKKYLTRLPGPPPPGVMRRRSRGKAPMTMGAR